MAKSHEQPTVDAFVYQQLDTNELSSDYTSEEIENAIVSLYLRENDIKKPVISEIRQLDNDSRSEVVDDVGDHIFHRRNSIDLMTVEKYFESLLETEQRKERGSYYTPHFLIDFVTKNTVIGDSQSKIVDLACGSGGFLIGAASVLENKTDRDLGKILEENIFGIDISENAIRKSRIVLNLFAVANGIERDLDFNLIRGNSLTLNFPEIFQTVFEKGGFDTVVGNPPYVKPQNGEIDSIRSDYRTVPNSGRATNLCLPFLELMVRVSRRNHSHCGLIMPLSISYHSGRMFREARSIIRDTPGRWHFSFYDRSPDSLFGDDIKTRNSIVFLDQEHPTDNEIFTTNLIRWNSSERASLFEKIEYAKVTGLSIVEKGIPKVSADIEIEVLNELNHLPLKTYLATDNSDEESTLYFYSTAYNWLPIFREIPTSFDEDGNEFVPQSINTLECASNRRAHVVHSILGSLTAYWYWLVYSDGFHLNRSFIENFPVNPWYLSDESKSELVELSEDLKSASKSSHFLSNNSGLKIGNYNRLECLDVINEIDAILINDLDLPSKFHEFLKRKIWQHVSAGRKDFKNKDNLNQLIGG